jgi:hypothetical protein
MSGFYCQSCGALIGRYPCGVCNFEPHPQPRLVRLASSFRIRRIALLATTSTMALGISSGHRRRERGL